MYWTAGSSKLSSLAFLSSDSISVSGDGGRMASLKPFLYSKLSPFLARPLTAVHQQLKSSKQLKTASPWQDSSAVYGVNAFCRTLLSGCNCGSIWLSDPTAWVAENASCLRSAWPTQKHQAQARFPHHPCFPPAPPGGSAGGRYVACMFRLFVA